MNLKIEEKPPVLTLEALRYITWCSDVYNATDGTFLFTVKCRMHKKDRKEFCSHRPMAIEEVQEVDDFIRYLLGVMANRLARDVVYTQEEFEKEYFLEYTGKQLLLTA